MATRGFGNSIFTSELPIQHSAALQAVLSSYTARATNAYARARLDDYADRVQLGRVISNFASFGVRDLISQVLAVVPQEVAKEVRVFADLTRGSITRNRETRLKALHEEVALDALRHVRLAYTQRTPRRGDIGSLYRRGETGKDGKPVRYSGERLLQAITDPRMYRVARDGLDFIDPVWLDSQARQWYRLNFGAGQKGQSTKKRPAPRMVMWGHQVAADFGLERFGPSGPFRMPAGFWYNPSLKATMAWEKGRNDDQFFAWNKESGQPLIEGLLANKKLKRNANPNHVRFQQTMTMGIEGSRFLDVGVNRIAKTLPLAYQRLFDEWLNEYFETGGGPVASQVVRGSERTIRRAYNLNKESMRQVESQRRLRSFRPGSRAWGRW